MRFRLLHVVAAAVSSLLAASFAGEAARCLSGSDSERALASIARGGTLVLWPIACLASARLSAWRPSSRPLRRLAIETVWGPTAVYVLFLAVCVPAETALVARSREGVRAYVFEGASAPDVYLVDRADRSYYRHADARAYRNVLVAGLESEDPDTRRRARDATLLLRSKTDASSYYDVFESLGRRAQERFAEEGGIR